MITGLWMFLIIPPGIMSNFRVIDFSYHILQCYTLTRLRRSNQQKIILNRFPSAFYPEKHVATDEMLVKGKGRSKYKMYYPAKPEKYRIKTFGLCDSLTGYIYNILVYFGKDRSYNG